MKKERHCERGLLPALDGRKIPYILEFPNTTESKGVFLLLHGLGVDKNEYLDFYVTLSQKLCGAGYEVLRIDFPAHGESTAKSHAFILLNCIADAIVSAKFAIDRTNTKALHIFGTSFGAGPAVITASFFTDILKSVTLLAPALSYRELYIEPTHPMRLDRYKDFYQKSILAAKSVQIDDNVKLDWKNALEFALIDIDPHLVKTATQTTIIHGDKDSMVPYEFSIEIVERIKGIDLILVPDMDHGFMHYKDDEGTNSSSQNNLQLIFEKTIQHDTSASKIH